MFVSWTTTGAKMKHWYQRPGKLLTELVRTVLIIEGFSEPDSDSLPIFTNGIPILFCKTEKTPSGYEHVAQLTLHGNFIDPGHWTTNNHSTIIAYFFKPFVLAGLFNMPAKKLLGTPVDLFNCSPHKYNALRTQLIYADSTSRKVEVLDHLIVQQLNENQKILDIIQYATDQIMCNSGTEILSEILQELKLNERTFQRIFKKYVGVTATQYRRICQFDLSFRQLQSQRFGKISDVAFSNGFADQSHFIRSFKEFTQTTPNDYLRNGLTDKKP
ncbi:helix-turn-helix domain-containing protein [Dinghuibacter silviterrae]|uniref:AraC-like DNA-binding protein n=1 Tax=Dinghuibacter silviterrae TaxID=1539049 RepID=A0A4R8DIJ7_9BACT|nr:AraC family transcriptional regulator [Dinghuibacter silviterrae]TDW97387.1 AraC-like DNA-binding protein [Dinghuibacter silviterrae]